MRVIVFYVPNIMPGGAERVCVNLANYLSEDQKVTVYLMTKYGGTYDSLVNASVKRIETKGRTLMSILFLLYKINPDVIMSTMASANVRLILLKFFLFTDTLFITRSPAICRNWRLYDSFKSKLLNLLGNMAYKLSDFVIANSPDTAESLIKCCGVPVNKIYTIGNPVVSNKCLNDRIISNKKPNKPKYILAVGSFKPVKRYDLLLEVFGIVSKRTDLNLHIIGGGGLESEIINKIKKMGLSDRVSLLGIKKDLTEDYRQSECLVLCSEYEGFGNVIVEALSQGTIPICFNCPGGPKYILDEGKYGVLVPFGDVSGMAQEIINVTTGVRNFNKAELINRADFFSIEKKSTEYFSIFEKMYCNKYRTKS